MYSLIRDYDGTIVPNAVSFTDPTNRVMYTVQDGDARWPDYQAWLVAGNSVAPAPVFTSVKVPNKPGE